MSYLALKEYENIAATLEEYFHNPKYKESIKRLIGYNNGDIQFAIYDLVKTMFNIDILISNELQAEFEFKGNGTILGNKDLYQLLRKWAVHAENLTFCTWVTLRINAFTTALADIIIKSMVY